MGRFPDWSATRNSGDFLHYNNIKRGARGMGPSTFLKICINLETIDIIQ
jgi:hypothetical protein